MKNRPLKFVLELFIPVIIVVLYFVISDPFAIVWHYDVFFPEKGGSKTGRDHDYVSVCTFDNYNDSLHYNSFIFGNSKSRYYLVEDWKKHLDSSAVCYHMDASNETLEGVWLKLSYVSQRAPINNCLLILDPLILSETKVNKSSYLFYPAPQTTPERDRFDFLVTGFMSFVNPKFFFFYTDWLIFGKDREYAKEHGIFENPGRQYDYRWNENTWPEKEAAIANGTYFDEDRIAYLNKNRKGAKYSKRCIFDEQNLLLMKIHSVLERKNTNYKVIISPAFNQSQLHPDDYTVLCSIFGQDNVFDFSGKNWISDDYQNFYDEGHYRFFVADSIMNIVYTTD